MTNDEMLALVERMSAHHPHLYPLFSHEFGDAVVGIEPAQLLETARDLHAAGFDRLIMVTAVDRGEVFVLVYRLHSRALTAAVFLKTKVPRANPRIESLCSIWPAANWQEREVYDLFGVEFEGHPDPRRILMPYDYVGHPLRRDFESPDMIRRPDYI
jgi:NADH:ubiquinone oxidoreductase subunit C